MKRKFLIVTLTLVCAVCLALGISACGAGEMEEGVVYFTDFSIKYTSAADSPNGDIDESYLTDEISGSVQSYYLVMNFDMQLASNTDGLEYITVKFVVLDANVVETIINYANTSNVSAITSDGQTTLTATYSLPDKAKSVKNINLVLELKPKTTGTTDIIYSFSSDIKDISGYTDADITYNYTSNYISIGKTSLEYTLNDDGQSYSVTGIGTKSGVVKFKETYNGLPVTAIGGSAFHFCSLLESITIPDSVTSIGSFAFYKCTSLTSIAIPDSVTSIGNNAFRDCAALESITIPNSITSIGDNAFYNCTALESITIPNGVTSIGNYAFRDCTALTGITIPNSVTSIGNMAFYNCTALTSITIGKNVSSIGGYVFYNTAYYNDSNNWEDKVLYIGNYLIKAYTSISGSYTIKDETTIIAGSAFYKCTALTSVTIGSGVTSIGWSAFSNCTSLTGITIPDSVTTIGRYAFYECTALTSVTFENTNGWYVTTTEDDANGTDISSNDLSDTSTAATYLKSTYYDYYWYRN